MQKIELWTDGSCVPNPGVGGWAAIVIDENDRRTRLFGGEQQSTNNRMELTAIIEGLQSLDKPCHVTIFTDSQLTMNCAMGKWKRKTNYDLWMKFNDAAARHQIAFRKVKGHADIELNELADKLAEQGRLMVAGEVVS